MSRQGNELILCDGNGHGLIEGAVHVHGQVVTSRQLAPPAL